MAQGREKEGMTRLKKIMAAAALMVTLGGCSAWAQQGYVQVSELSANYTETYINYGFYDTKGRNLGLGGSANPFSKNGQGGGTCCALLPGPGQTVRVEWDEEPPNRSESKAVHYFSDHKLEVELISEPKEDLGKGTPSPRLDRIFLGEHVMRHMGE
jgi:hypothetical protein